MNIVKSVEQMESILRITDESSEETSMWVKKLFDV